jgi:hypothetical protein
MGMRDEHNICVLAENSQFTKFFFLTYICTSLGPSSLLRFGTILAAPESQLSRAVVVPCHPEGVPPKCRRSDLGIWGNCPQHLRLYILRLDYISSKDSAQPTFGSDLSCSTRTGDKKNFFEARRVTRGKPPRWESCVTFVGQLDEFWPVTFQGRWRHSVILSHFSKKNPLFLGDELTKSITITGWAPWSLYDLRIGVGPLIMTGFNSHTRWSAEMQICEYGDPSSSH